MTYKLKPSSVEVPVVETERLRLRGHTPEDLDAFAAMWADPEVTRHIGGKPISREEAWRKLLLHAGHWALLGFGYWAVEEKSSGRFVGDVGFANFKREIDPSLEDMPETGWVLASSSHGKGYATEAVRAALDWGLAHFGPVPTACIIDLGNDRSVRVAEKCGYKEVTRTTYKGVPTLMYRR